MAAFDPNITTLQFELFPERTLTLLAYHNVKNAKEVFAALRSGKLPDIGFLNPSYICGVFQIHVAANKALYYQSSQSMITKELTSELLHTLSAQRNIGLSLKEFGIRDDRQAIVAFVFDATETHIKAIQDIIQGDAIAMNSDDFNRLCDQPLVIKHYKIDQAELNIGSLESAVTNRIAVRDV